MEVAQFLPPQSVEWDPVVEFEARLEEAARDLDLEPWVLQRLKHPEREISVNLPLVGDDGAAVSVSGYRVQHSRIQGPSIGPVQLSPTARVADLRVAAATITLQSALLGLRLGGAAGAIVCDPDRMSERSLRHLVSDYVSALRDDIGPMQDVLTVPGRAWMKTCLESANRRIHDRHEPAAIVGMDLITSSVVSAGIVALVRSALRAHNLSDIRIAVQGFGATGGAIAEEFYRQGARVVAVADRSGGIIRSDGIDTRALAAYADQNGMIFGYPNADAGSNTDVLEYGSDVLVLAAAERQINPQNAARIRARVIVENTRNSVSVGTESLPQTCIVIPYLLAGAAPLTAWSQEWQRGLSYSALEPQSAVNNACALLVAMYECVAKRATESGISLGKAAFLAAVARLSTVLRLR